MKNLRKLIKTLSLALCFGLYLGVVSTPATAKEDTKYAPYQEEKPNYFFEGEDLSSKGEKYWSASKGKNVPWNELTSDEKQAIAKFAVMENGTGQDKVRAAEQELKKAQDSGDAEKIKEAEKKYNQAVKNKTAANSVYAEIRSQEGAKKGNSADKLTEAGYAAKDAAKKTKQKKEKLEAATDALSEAYASGDETKIQQAKANYDVAKGNFDKAKADQKTADKQYKNANKEYNKDKKQANKVENKLKKDIEKEQKKAEKDLKKANKDIEKLEKKCAEGKCSEKDQRKLAEAHAKAQNAQSDLDKANQKAMAFDTARNETGEINAYMDAREAEVAAENADDLRKQAEKEIQEAVSNAPQMCNKDEIQGNVFLLIACKATTTLADLRMIAYIISGFGMVALAYAAIFGKMNWKHLANIGIGLFLLSMMTPFIEYFVYSDGGKLKFGNYLPAGFTDVQGSDGEVEDCGKVNVDGQSSSLCEVLVMSDVKKEKWSLKDLKGSIEAGMNAVRNANDMYQATKNTISNVKNQVNNMASAIKNGGGGLDGIINGVTAVAGAAGNIVNSGQLLANNIANNASNLSNNIRDAGSTNQGREARAKHQAQLDALSKKCNAGNCSDKEKEAMQELQKVIENEKTGVDKWMENDGAGGGATILAGINKVGNIGDDVRNTANSVANAAHEGQTIGGGGALGTILGIGFGVGTGITDSMDAIDKNKNNGNFDFRSGETRRDDEYKSSSEYVKNSVTQGNKTIETLGDGSTRTTTRDEKGNVTSVTTVDKNGNATVKKSDGSTTIVDSNGKRTTTYQDGTTVVQNTDLSTTVTDGQGNQINKNALGNTTGVNLTQENKYRHQTAESNADALKSPPKGDGKDDGKKEEKPKEETEKKQDETPSATQSSNDKKDNAGGGKEDAAAKKKAEEEAKKKADAEKALREKAAQMDCSEFSEFMCLPSAMGAMPGYAEKCKECGYPKNSSSLLTK